ncbi:right-handed parallel beta-helix repeat-containing protein [Streptomyces thermoalcalitolerans]|uniref:Right-handed parallel beta-helix repeat-containing protein n=1 Tax=Streptomyces thermoalcalitolerans TaxID=65605 RepID=A0ABP3ZJ37_9ACTN
MTKRHTALLLSAAVLTASTVAVGLPHAHPRTFLVSPGESIQKAVDSAKTGDTILLAPGIYHESVKVTKPGLTLRGAGRDTVLEPAAKATGDCGERGNGICVEGSKDKRLQGVTIADLTVAGFSHAGVMALDTDRLTVRNVTAEKNKVWGLAEERSVRSQYLNNTARGNGDAGIFLANTITAEEGAFYTGGTKVAHNRLENNRIGVTVRRLRDLTVAANEITGNCAGVFVVGDENKPKAGDLTVSDNQVVENNKYCAATARLPYLQGSGIVLTGAEDTLVTRNTVVGNSGKSPLSGGIVLFKSMVGATSENNRIHHNALRGNSPADLVNQENTQHNNTFRGNACRASTPEGLC